MKYKVLLVLPLLALGACTAPWASTTERISDAARKWNSECSVYSAQGQQLGMPPVQCTAQLFGEAAARVMAGSPAVASNAPLAPTPTQSNLPQAPEPVGIPGVIKIYQ